MSPLNNDDSPIKSLPTPDPAPTPGNAAPPYPETIRGSGFYLSRLSGDEVPTDYLRWLNDPEVIEYLQVRFERRDKQSALAFIKSFDHVNSFLFGIHDAENDRHVGNITLRANPHHLFANCGYLIGEKTYWQTEAAVEAVRLICDFAFFERGLRKIVECTTENHIASNFNFKRLGFTFEGKIPDLYWSNGAYHAATYWSMSALKWAEISSRDPNQVTP